MKKVIVVLIVSLLAAPTYAKDNRKVMLRAHAQANQEGLDSKNQHSEKDIQVGQGDSSSQVWAALVTWDDRTVSATLQIMNAGKQPLLFIPSQMVLLLPNGHSYRAYNRADVLEQAYAAKSEKAARAYSGYNPPPVTTFKTNCSLNGDTATCQTTPDQSAQAGYALGYALGAAIRTAIAKRTFNKYIKQVEEEYLVSQQIAPGATAVGYVDFYVEDIHGGPFTLRIPAGEKTYDFVFGPELIALDSP